jgi:hypothetical protein
MRSKHRQGDENRQPQDGVVVWLPSGVPAMTQRAWRQLLGILVELTTVPVLDGQAERADHDG